jgi:DTW domain-containing protein YfiP
MSVAAEFRSDRSIAMRNRIRGQALDPLRCRRCRLHTDLCACDLLAPQAIATRLVLVAHRFEGRKPTNTGHLAVACLQGARMCLRGQLGVADEPVTWEPTSQPIFLFPCPEARPLDEWLAAQPRAPRDVTLIVPDGTWRQAKRVRRRVTGLADIPAVRLPSIFPSHYRLRRAHAGDQLATLEAVARALGILEGPTIEAHLLRVFRTVVDRTLWSNGRIASADVTGGIPVGARRDGPVKRQPAEPGTLPTL